MCKGHKVNKSCRACKFYTDSYGFRNGTFVGLYSSCDLKGYESTKCKNNNFNKWEERKNDK